MRRWTRAQRDMACGRCPALVRRGAPLFELSGPGWRKVRCAACAGEAVPDVIADSGRVYQVAQFAERIEAMRAGRDWKHAQAGEEGR